MCDRIVFGRVLRDTGDDRTFGQVQLGYRFIEVTHGSCLYTQCILSQVDRVHIKLENIPFAHPFFQLQCQILFLDLTFDTDKIGIFCYPAFKNIIFQKLLGDRAGALSEMPCLDRSHTGSDNTFDIDTVMLVETRIFDCNKSICHIFRDLVHFDITPVGVGTDKFCDLLAAVVVNNSRIAARCDIQTGNIGSGCQNPFKHTDTQTDTDDAYTDHTDEQCFQKCQ